MKAKALHHIYKGECFMKNVKGIIEVLVGMLIGLALLVAGILIGIGLEA